MTFISGSKINIKQNDFVWLLTNKFLFATLGQRAVDSAFLQSCRSRLEIAFLKVKGSYRIPNAELPIGQINSYSICNISFQF